VRDEQATAPDSDAVRVALWRALHVQIDPPPHVLAMAREAGFAYVWHVSGSSLADRYFAEPAAGA